MISRIIFSLVLLSLISCQEEKKVFIKQVKNEVWSVVEENNEFVKDAIRVRETYEYDENGLEIGHLLYDAKGDLTGKELAVFDKGSKMPVGTKYFAANDSLLSYYSLTYDDKDRKISRKGYDASNDELLRVEEFEYDAKDNVAVKKILNASNQVQRVFQFNYDAYGNETSLTVKDGNGLELFSEEFRIVKLDEEDNWIENWGWRNDSPVSYRTRSISYYR